MVYNWGIIWLVNLVMSTGYIIRKSTIFTTLWPALGYVVSSGGTHPPFITRPTRSLGDYHSLNWINHLLGNFVTPIYKPWKGHLELTVVNHVSKSQNGSSKYSSLRFHQMPRCSAPSSESSKGANFSVAAEGSTKPPAVEAAGWKPSGCWRPW